MTEWWQGFMVGGGVVFVLCFAYVHAACSRAASWRLTAETLEDEVKSLDPEGWDLVERLRRGGDSDA